MLIFYVDETGTASLATVPGIDPPELVPGTAAFFTLAAIGIRDSARKPLAEYLLRVKAEHLGAAAGASWDDTEIKGRYLLHVAKSLRTGRKHSAPPGYSAIADQAAMDAFLHALGLAMSVFRPLILANVVDKYKMIARGIGTNPIGIAYSYLQRNIALTLEHQLSGESAIIVADQQTQHEALFKSGGIHEIRSQLEKDLTRVPNYNLVLDKPLWLDTDLSMWDREILQLADIASFLVTKVIDDGEPPAELARLWQAMLPQFALHHKSGKVLGRGIAMYPPRSSRLSF
ncbi:DUF3800 domain-containing protein [Microbacterium sp. Root180]|uniref:DUF3800 domain-containing protein n=1 Tax=Microbacterium sp. Root180 TaxID=1736483 RepID=UPI0006FFDC6D|nr:DUF3800 domain-containing protein [Microbacterium sp. Root180]KRB37597.1 hypothetical protein ASD93_04425 [Microbacterium sp. Root180]